MWHALPPDPACGNPFSAASGHVDEPGAPPLRAGRREFRGWIAVQSLEVEPEFLLGGERVQDVRYHARPDVVALRPGFHVRGWSFTAEIRPGPAASRGVVELEIRQSRSTLARGAWRLDRRDRAEAPPLVLFLHIPKCAGTAVARQLARSPGAIRVETLYAERLDPRWIEADLAPRIADIDVVFGHFWFGIHRYLPRPVRYVTVLRDPFEQVLSQYFFRKNVLLEPGFVACETVFEAMGRHPEFFDNIATRYLAGLPPEAPVDPTAVGLAIDALGTHFDLVGFQERMPDTCRRLARYLGVPVDPEPDNATPVTHERRMLDVDRFRAAAFDLVRHDLEVVAAALRHRSCLA